MNTIMRSGWSQSRSNLALGTLGLGTFVMGTAELVVVGILNLIAQDMGVSISTAGQLVIAYALGISIGGPILTALTIRFGRRFQLWMSLAIYIGGNVLAVVAVAFSMFIVARIVTGSIHGLFIGVALAVAAVLVPPDRQGRVRCTGRTAGKLDRASSGLAGRVHRNCHPRCHRPGLNAGLRPVRRGSWHRRIRRAGSCRVCPTGAGHAGDRVSADGR